ncbi:MAG: lysophospholipid acyltransferase family protein [Rubripirellula sp.]|nr:lysophospholipid acyltransferase family protein [Rubripirellula sp.]
MSSKQPKSGHELLSYQGDDYVTPSRRTSWFSRTFPTGSFYFQFISNVVRSSAKARRGKYDSMEWSRTSFKVLESLESVGVKTEISGVEHIRELDSPCVFVGNHMSMLETIVLPSIIQPVCDVTFVVKQSLLEYPVFRHIVRARDPIAVSRDNSREDLKTVMKGGVERIENGISIVVFPQTTRSQAFDPSHFNSIGVKLALRAQVPVIPIALITDAWGNGKKLKDFGRIDPSKTVRFAFGEPIVIEGRGNQQQQQIVSFIEGKLNAWRSELAD